MLWNPTATAYQSEPPSSSSEQNMTSLGIPFSDWLNENVSKMCRNLLLNMCPV